MPETRKSIRTNDRTTCGGEGEKERGHAMNARQWLGRSRGIEREIAILLRARDEARDQALNITAKLSGDVVAATKNPHKFDRLVELECAIDEQIEKLVAVKAEIASAIGKINDGRQRCVLLSYYIRCKSLEEIAAENRYSYRQTLRIHHLGILAVGEIINLLQEDVL